MHKRRKIIKWTIWSVLVITLGVFALNFHLTKSLEKLLKKELIERTASGTDGFYKLSFEHLSISFLKGELKIEGIYLRPDSTLFSEWDRKDSLPATYFTAKVDAIEFKGINLTWRHDYKKLHFATFNIEKPDITIVAPDSLQTKNTLHATKEKPKTLFEVVSPYINILTVQVLNLDNASVKYTVENTSPASVYALDDISFHAYEFRLDEYSSQRGNLLYCHDFEFITNKKQTILNNRDFSLDADKIHLNTKDSLIRIVNIRLNPQEKLWQQTGLLPDEKLKISIDTIMMGGLKFWRNQGLNYFTARNLEVNTTDISLTQTYIKDLSTPAKRLEIKPLSLYDIISPVLHSVKIEQIALDKAALEYKQKIGAKENSYSVDNFGFVATRFSIDSLENSARLFYSDNFVADANGIEGTIQTQNNRFSVNSMRLDAAAGDIYLDKIKLKPISIRAKTNYIAGNIDSLYIKGLKFDNGVSIAKLHVVKPHLHGVLADTASINASKKRRKGNSSKKFNLRDYFNPYFTHIDIGELKLKSGNILFENKESDTVRTYRVNSIDVFVDKLALNPQTMTRTKEWFFDYRNIGFRLGNFNNVLPGGEYQLSLGNIEFSTHKGLMSIKNISLMPVDSTASERLLFRSPEVCMRGLHRFPLLPLQTIEVESFNIDHPYLEWIKSDSTLLNVSLQSFFIDKLYWDSLQLSVGNVGAVDPRLSYAMLVRKQTHKENKEENPSLEKSFDLNKLDLYEKISKISPLVHIGSFDLGEVNLKIAYRDHKDSLVYQSLDSTHFAIDNLTVDSKKRLYELGNIYFSTRNLSYPIDGGFYTLKVGGVDLTKNSLRLSHIHMDPLYPMMEFAYKEPHHQDWFDVSCGEVLLSGINVPHYISDNVIEIDSINIQDALLQNFKNKQIPRMPYIMPMVYSGIQKIPVKTKVGLVNVRNFTVNYQELERKAKAPGVLVINEMNGTVSGFTNIVSEPNQFITLNATGNLMGNAMFKGEWKVPVDSLNDCFYLSGEIGRFEFKSLNPLITPMINLEITNGFTTRMHFNSRATSKGAHVDMTLLYDSLQLAFIKEHDGDTISRKLISDLINLVLKKSNPSYSHGVYKERKASLDLVRNPYHSTFNYFWQILRPALASSVGVPKKTQEAAMRTAGFLERVKLFFHGKKGKKYAEEEAEANENLIFHEE